MYKMLVCDDDPDILDLLELTFLEDFSVIKALDGEQGWKILQEQSIDIIILDYIMPKIDGITLCKMIKKDPVLSQIPVLMLTGKADTDDKLLGLESGADDYITKPFEPQELIVRVKNLLRRTRLILDTNPLTRLPGNNAICEEIKKRINSGSKFAVAYVDLNHFKSYNDKYGFNAGDELIKHTAKILMQTVKDSDPKGFIGHIGGDDFVFITAPDKIEPICESIINKFDGSIRHFYDQESQKLGYIETLNREGKLQKFPFVSIAISIVTNEKRPLSHIAEISQIAAEVKCKVKSFGKSAYLKDRRGQD